MPRIGQERFVTPASADMTDEKDTLKENMRRRLITTINSPLVCNTNNPILVALCSDGKHRSFFYLVVFPICPRYSSPHGTSGCEWDRYVLVGVCTSLYRGLFGLLGSAVDLLTIITVLLPRWRMRTLLSTF